MQGNEMINTGTMEGRPLCWSCRQETGSGPFCKHCVRIQPIEELGNYFSLFDQEKSFDIDVSGLKKKFFELSRKFHPDFYTDNSAQEKIVARNNTAYLNTALNVLSNPIQRAEYLLSIVSGTFASNPAPPQELFEEILEAGELIDRHSLSDDDRRKLSETRDSFQARQRELTDSLSGLFARLMNSEENAKGEITTHLDQIKYLRSISARIVMALVEKGEDGHQN